MEILSIVGIGLTAAVLSMVLRQYRPEYALLVSLAAGVYILIQICTGIVPVIDQISGIMDSTNMPTEYASILFKALGICFVTQVACDTCKDAGESAISGKIEIAGRVAVLVISLPLFRQVLTIVYALIM